MTRLPRKDNPAPEIPTIWAAHHCRRDVPSEGSVLAGVVMFIFAVAVIVGGVLVWGLS